MRSDKALYRFSYKQILINTRHYCKIMLTSRDSTQYEDIRNTIYIFTYPRASVATDDSNSLSIQHLSDRNGDYHTTIWQTVWRIEKAHHQYS